MRRPTRPPNGYNITILGALPTISSRKPDIAEGGRAGAQIQGLASRGEEQARLVLQQRFIAEIQAAVFPVYLPGETAETQRSAKVAERSELIALPDGTVCPWVLGPFGLVRRRGEGRRWRGRSLGRRHEA